MSSTEDLTRFAKLGFEDFRRLAADTSLSAYEKIGFPNSYREGKEPLIFADILGKLERLREPGSTVLDIGPGCSDVPRLLAAHCRQLGQELHLVDSAEMLDQLDDGQGVHKHAAFYPECPELLERLHGRADAVIVYSVLQYIFVDTNLYKFLDVTLALLAPGGALLLGDIPNVSMRKRFFSSGTGKTFHKAFTGTDTEPDVAHHMIERDQIDDAVVFGILQRARAAGFHAYVLPQPPELPLANRREDILIIRP
ncbi:MAG: class I SAM-dependent methyltransferase [Pseudomonadota bacterium]|nr:class I SAM-dependent methyltransferase [Pseudomonadota bacterium]